MFGKMVIYMTMISYPCGVGSSCCGPIGQSKEDIDDLKSELEWYIQDSIEVVDVEEKSKKELPKAVRQYLNTFGAGILPLITINDDIVCMSTMDKDEIVSKLSAK